MPESTTELLAAITALQSQVKELSERLGRLEGQAQPKPVAIAASAPPKAVAAQSPEPISEETLLVISAAVAAFLGERRRIRQIRLLSSTAWAMQGRVSIQASHQLGH